MSHKFYYVISFLLSLASSPSIGDEMNCQRYFCFVNGIVEIRTAPEEYQNKPVLDITNLFMSVLGLVQQDGLIFLMVEYLKF